MNELPEGEFVNDHERSEGDNGRGVIRLKPYILNIFVVVLVSV